MDTIDRLILGILRDDGRMSVATLADEVGLSASATSERIRRLVRQGVIAGYSARIDPVASGRPVDALIEVRLDPAADFDALDRQFTAWEEVVDAMHLTGRWDYLVRVRCGSIDDLETFIRRLKDTGSVLETSTRIALRTIDGFPRQALPPQTS